MRIILLGAPGTGKGTQSQLIEKKYNIPQISTGDILRDNIYSKTTIGNKIKEIIEKGKLISDDIVCHVIKTRIQKKDCINGFLLDGFPRTQKQAFYLSNNNIKIDCVIELTASYKSILHRISGRRVHVQSGRIYHIQFNPPKIFGKDDITGQPLIKRKDDRKESVKKRLREYFKTTYPLIQHYLHEEKIGKIKFFRINGDESTSVINKKIELILNKIIL